VNALDVVCGCGAFLVGDGATRTVEDQPVAVADPDPPIEQATAASPPVSCPDCGARVQPTDRYCESCFAELPARALTTQPPADPDAHVTRRDVTPVRVTVHFAGGALVQAGIGEEVPIGRHSSSPVSAHLRERDNVSRFHATVGVDRAGRAWVRDEGSANGTYVDDRPVRPGDRIPLADGVRLRLASDVTAVVQVPPAGAGDAR
jgi:hypothetical protein